MPKSAATASWSTRYRLAALGFSTTMLLTVVACQASQTPAKPPVAVHQDGAESGNCPASGSGLELRAAAKKAPTKAPRYTAPKKPVKKAAPPPKKKAVAPARHAVVNAASGAATDGANDAPVTPDAGTSSIDNGVADNGSTPAAATGTDAGSTSLAMAPGGSTGGDSGASGTGSSGSSSATASSTSGTSCSNNSTALVGDNPSGLFTCNSQHQFYNPQDDTCYDVTLPQAVEDCTTDQANDDFGDVAGPLFAQAEANGWTVDQCAASAQSGGVLVMMFRVEANGAFLTKFECAGGAPECAEAPFNQVN